MLEQFSTFALSHEGISHEVRRSGTGPPVIVMHEVPGITPEVAAFAERTVDEGFTVFLPEMFGALGKPISNRYLATSTAKVCVSKEFHMLAARSSSPITKWLRALSRHVHEEFGGAGVGAIGMCVTGNFALALMVDPWLMAPVLSQPSLPVGVGSGRKRALHLSDDDLATVKRRAIEEGQCVLGLRFTGDPLCPPERFETLRTELGDRFEGIEIDSSKGNAAGLPGNAHSVVTTEFLDEDGSPTKAANDRVMAFFHENLDSGVSELGA